MIKGRQHANMLALTTPGPSTSNDLVAFRTNIMGISYPRWICRLFYNQINCSFAEDIIVKQKTVNRCSCIWRGGTRQVYGSALEVGIQIRISGCPVETFICQVIYGPTDTCKLFAARLFWRILSQRELCVSFLETIRAIICINSRYCCPIVDFW